MIGEDIRAIRETPVGGMGHACELETSLMLAACPDVVHRERAEADSPVKLSQFEGRDLFDTPKVSGTKTFRELS